MNRTFKRGWRYFDKDLGADRIIPAGWQGDLPEAVARKADADGVTLKPQTKPKATKPSAELAAARKAVTDAEKALKDAKSDAEKEQAELTLAELQADLAELEA